MLSSSTVSLYDSMDNSPPGSSVHGTSQARILEWGSVFPFPPPDDLPDPEIKPESLVSPSLQVERFFFFFFTTEPPRKPYCRIIGLGRFPWRRERLPTPVFWPGKFHGLYSPWGFRESDTAEWLSPHFFFHNKRKAQTVLLSIPQSRNSHMGTEHKAGRLHSGRRLLSELALAGTLTSESQPLNCQKANFCCLSHSLWC